MKRHLARWRGTAGGLVLMLAVGAWSATPPPVDFNRDIRPILSDNCFYCHGPDAGHRKAGLRLDVEEAAKADLGGYHAVVPGRPEQSELVARIFHDDPDERMPPADSGKSLSSEEKELMKRWIEEGARWQQHWAYVPPQSHPLPEVANERWPRNWIDPFILARLEAEGLGPSEPADPVTLIRRLSFDLTGLPPSPEEVAAFREESGEAAYEQLVDRLLGLPGFGERMAMYWLDLVRYADTVGYHGDQDQSISPYRDWVIDAFNDNLPFDRFTQAQLAGDLLPEAGIEAVIASGYNRLLQTSHEGGVQAKEYLAIYAADRVRNVSAVWFGATIGCAQCHDHKFDPYTMEDFYSLAAFFADLDEARHLSNAPNALPTVREPEIKVLDRVDRVRMAELRERATALESRLAEVSGEVRAELEAELAAVREKMKHIDQRARKTMVSRSIEPRTMRVLPRGNWLDESGPVVQPAVPGFLGRLPVDGRATRLDLARWLTDPEAGAGLLTARVMVNRFWYLMFGSGLAGVLDDFGGQGEPPVHPELLDNLAIEFVASGWDVKHMMKLLVMSRTYRQSSLASPSLQRKDPYNRLFARQSRHRLPAEMIRDNALAVSGLLVREVGGASVKPYQPLGYYRHLNFPKRKYEAHGDERQWRRGLYVHWQRQFLHPMLKAFDAPNREECTAQRARSNTPLAALTLLNDPSFVEAARAFATRILREGGGSPEARLDYACRRALSREPDVVEREVLLELLASSRQSFAEEESRARALIGTGEAPVPTDLKPAELAAWTMVARALLNLNEALTRN